MFEAIKNNPRALEYASNRLKRDRDLVLFAVKKDGLALRYADKILQDDREIISYAIMSTALALEYASNRVILLSDELLNDFKI